MTGPYDYALLRAERAQLTIPEWRIGDQHDQAGLFARWDLPRTDAGSVGRNRESVSGERLAPVKVDVYPSNVLGYEAAVSRLNCYDVITADLGVLLASNVQ